MKASLLCRVFLWAMGFARATVPDTGPSCCEGRILVLLDSSGSVTDYEFSRLLELTADVLRPLPAQVRVGLLQVGTQPHLAFHLDAHRSQESLQEALLQVRHLQGDTNTAAALTLARGLLMTEEEGGGGGGGGAKILLWLTDGVEPGDVSAAMTALKDGGAAVLVVSTVHADFQVLGGAATPPLESHLFSVDMEHIHIIAEPLRAAIMKLLRSPPDSASRTRLRPHSDQTPLPTLSATFPTLPEVLSPAVVSVSDPGPRQVQVSWGPLRPDRVNAYSVEYGSIPSGPVRTVRLDGGRDRVLLTGLDPGTQYLVTVSAEHLDGTQRSMSVRACTEPEEAELDLQLTFEGAEPELLDLQLTSEGAESELQVEWVARENGLKGFWIRWEREDADRDSSSSSSSSPSPSSSSSSSSSIFLPPSSRSTRLPRLPPGSRVCVVPVHGADLAPGLCCSHTGSWS